jgi:hypothetical protein
MKVWVRNILIKYNGQKKKRQIMINKTLHRKLKTVKPEFHRSSQMLAFNTRELGLLLHALYNNISVISWRSVLFVEETGVPGENHRSVASH